MGIVSAAPNRRAASSENGRREIAMHPRAGLRREPGQQRAEETDADDRHRLARLDAAAPEDFMRAAQRLAGERPAGESVREAHHRVRRGTSYSA